MRGGRRPNAGRKIGSPNKSTRDIRALAQPHGPDAVAALAKIMTESESDSARIAAAKELLDRGYGKAKQLVDIASEEGPRIIRLVAASPIAPGDGQRAYMDMINRRP
jgi:hypothetical protein